MADSNGKQKTCQHHKLVTALAFSYILVILVVCFMGYGAFYTLQRLDKLNEDYSNLQEDVNLLKKMCIKQEVEMRSEREKREVVSSNKVDISSLLRGPQGVAGPPGQPGKDGHDGTPGKDGRDGFPGRDGKDFSSLDLLRGVINDTVQKEWRQMSSRLPNYSGAVYLRWGRTSCPSKSKLIYKGRMAGPSYLSGGGGSNYQCLPDDPEYESRATGVYSSLRSVRFYLPFNKNAFSKDLHKHSVPCVACETSQRVSQLMIPAKTRCPTDDWTLEYKGLLMSEYEHDVNKNNEYSGSTSRGSGMYMCVDAASESLDGRASHEGTRGAYLYLVRAGCDVKGSGALSRCPPYRSDKTALSCVVCSK